MGGADRSGRCGGGAGALRRRREADPARDLAALAGSDDRLRKLESEREAEFARIAKEAAALGKSRRRAAKKLAAAVEATLADLAMPAARFEVAFQPVEPASGIPCGPNGAEAPELRFSANAGESPRSLRQVASGGELSRVFLALKNVLRRADVGTWLAFGERGLKSQLREAGKRGVRYVVILGEDELAAGTAVVRDMEAGEQTDVALAGLVDWLKARV